MADMLQDVKSKLMQSGGGGKNPKDNRKKRLWKFKFEGDHNLEKKQTIKKNNCIWKWYRNN
eukprot:8311559-Ditylum_brightwellii.AAC.2